MTIAMGFQASDGVLLCADTEISRGWGKSYEAKIHILSKGSRGFQCACVYAGDVDYMKKVLPSLEGAVGDQTSNLVKRLDREWAAIHKKSKARERNKEECPYIEVLFAVGNRKGKPQLYNACLDILRPEPRYGAIGIGQEVARSFVDPYFPRGQGFLPTRDVRFLAVGGLHQAKSFVRGCGGKSQFLWFDEVSDLEDLPIQIEEGGEMQEDFLFLQKQLGSLTLAFSDLGSVRFGGALRTFQKEVGARQRVRMRRNIRRERDAERDEPRD